LEDLGKEGCFGGEDQEFLQLRGNGEGGEKEVQRDRGARVGSGYLKKVRY